MRNFVIFDMLLLNPIVTIITIILITVAPPLLSIDTTIMTVVVLL